MNTHGPIIHGRTAGQYLVTLDTYSSTPAATVFTVEIKSRSGVTDTVATVPTRTGAADMRRQYADRDQARQDANNIVGWLRDGLGLTAVASLVWGVQL